MATKPKTAAKPRAKKPVVVTDRTRIKSILGTAQFLGVDRSVIERWIKVHGCPIVREGGKGTGNEYELDVAEVFKWRVAFVEKQATEAAGGGETEDIDHKTKLLKFAQAAALVAPVDYTEAVMQRCFGELRQTMMSLSARISRSMDGFPKEKVDAWCTAVDVIIRDALQAAADSIEDAKIETPEYVTMEGDDANSSV